MIKERHKLIYDVTTRLESFSLNTVISAFMEHNNTASIMSPKILTVKVRLSLFLSVIFTWLSPTGIIVTDPGTNC